MLKDDSKRKLLGKNVAILLTAVQAASFWPVWRWYVARLFDGSDEPWGILALVTAVVFIGTRKDNFFPTSRHFAYSVLPTAFYALSFYYVPPLAHAALAITALGITLSGYCSRHPIHLGLFGLLVLSLPIIASLQFYLGYPIRMLTTLIATHFIALTGYSVTQHGTCINWLGDPVSVDAPCAGIKMLWTGLYLTFSLCSFTGLTTIQTWIAYSFSTLVIFIGNVIRATSLFYLEAGIIHGPSWAHQFVGLLVFSLVTFTIFTINSTIAKYSHNCHCEERA